MKLLSYQPYIFILCLQFIIYTGSAQIDPPHLEVIDPDIDVAVLQSGSGTTRLNFLNNNTISGSLKAGFLESATTTMRLGLSNNNMGGTIKFMTRGIDRMTMDALGRVGLGTAPNSFELFRAATSDYSTTSHFINTSNNFGTAIHAESSSFAGIFAEGRDYGGYFEVSNVNGNAIFADGNSWINGKLRIADEPTTGAVEGQMRFNAANKTFEGYDGTKWVRIGGGRDTIIISHFNFQGESGPLNDYNQDATGTYFQNIAVDAGVTVPINLPLGSTLHTVELTYNYLGPESYTLRYFRLSSTMTSPSFQNGNLMSGTNTQTFTINEKIQDDEIRYLSIVDNTNWGSGSLRLYNMRLIYSVK